MGGLVFSVYEVFGEGFEGVGGGAEGIEGGEGVGRSGLGRRLRERAMPSAEPKTAGQVGLGGGGVLAGGFAELFGGLGDVEDVRRTI